MYSIVGHCPHCGAPIYVQSMWHGVLPPPSLYSCACVTQPRVTTSTGTGIFITPQGAKNVD